MTVAGVWEAYRADRAGRPVAVTMGYMPAVLAISGICGPTR